MDGDTILQAVGVLVAAVVGLSQVTNRPAKCRTRLKQDLEILELLDSLSSKEPQYSVVRTHVDNSVKKIYESGAGAGQGFFEKFRVYDWGSFVFGVLLLFGGVLWTLYLDGFSWWSLLSGFIALAGLGSILNGLEDQGKTHPQKGTSASTANAANAGGGE